MIRNCSTTSRTGYFPQSRAERIRETFAILTSILCVGLLISAVIFAARFL